MLQLQDSTETMQLDRRRTEAQGVQTKGVDLSAIVNISSSAHSCRSELMII